MKDILYTLPRILSFGFILLSLTLVIAQVSEYGIYSPEDNIDLMLLALLTMIISLNLFIFSYLYRKLTYIEQLLEQ